MRIEGQRPVGASAAGGVRKGGAVNGERFSLAEESAPAIANSAASESAHALAAREAMRAEQHVGRVSEGRLRIVALTSQAKTDTQDAELESIISEIELRARLELAKLGIF